MIAVHPVANAPVSRDSVGAHNGLRTVVWQQQLDGVPVFDAVLIGNSTAAGELVTLSSSFLPDVAAKADAGTPNRAATTAVRRGNASDTLLPAACFSSSAMPIRTT